MADDYYVKDGKVYLCGPLSSLNADPLRKGQQRGDKLQAFFDANRIDFDLRSGTGLSKYEIYTFYGDDTEEVKGCAPVFRKTNFQRDFIRSNGKQNMRACEEFRDAYKQNIFTSGIIIFGGANSYPRILYSDAEGNPKLSEPLNELNLEDYRPKKPNLFKRFMHAINENWYSKDFNKYNTKNREFRKFSNHFNKMKSVVEEEFENHTILGRREINEGDHMKKVENLESSLEKQNDRIDAILGPVQKDAQDLIALRTYKPENFPHIPLEYPENVPFTNHEIAMIAYALLADADVAKNVNDNPFLSAEDNMSENYCGMTHDVFFYGRPQSNSFFKAYNPARAKAYELIENYMAGNKDGLAKAIGKSIKMQFETIQQLNGVTIQNAAVGDSLIQMLGILNKDPELMAASGLTKDDMMVAKAHIAEKDLFEKMLESERDMVEDKVRCRKVPQEVKEERLANILLSRMLKAETKNALNNRQNAPEAVKLQKELEKTALEQGMLKDQYIKDQQNVELKERIAEYNEKLNSIQSKYTRICGATVVTPFMKLLGNDDSKKTNQKALVEKMKNTEIFKQYARMSNEELSNIVAENGQFDNSFDDKCLDIIKQIAKAEPKPEAKQPDEKVIIKEGLEIDETEKDEIEKII